MTRLQDILALPSVTHNLVQGSPEWDQFRLQHRGASEAAAMLGLSKKMKRSELLHMKHIGLAREFSEWLQRNVLDKGHELEALARPLVEEAIGDDLYPVTRSRGHISASCDGLTMSDDDAMEHKQWNEELAAAVRAGTLPEEHEPQCQQVLLVTGAKRLHFVVSDGTPDRMVRLIVLPDHAFWERLVAGWDQFDADLAAYQPPEAAPVVVANHAETLPSVAVRVSGEIAIADNFKAFETALRDFLEHRLIREPKTDQDFADLDVQIKAMKGAEAALDAAEGQMLAQIQTVDQAKKTKDMLAKLVRDNRLMAEKLLASEKERRRGEIVAGGIGALKAHIDGLNKRLGKPYMPATASAVDFGNAIKGLKSLASMEDKVATALANAKIAANEIADRIEANLRHLREHAAEYVHLFPDTAAIVLKAPEDLQALATARISEHRAAEERRAAELAERERARIRAEEQERADREARERAAAEQRQREEQEALERRQSEEATARTEPQREPIVAQPPAPAVIPMPTRAPAPAATAPSIRLGQINQRLTPLAVDAACLAALGFPHSATEGAAKLWHAHQIPGICDAIMALASRVRDQHREAA
jgi:predicted phage-related endonuclease